MAIPAILQQLQRSQASVSPSNLQKVRGMMQMVRTAQNPTAAMQSVIVQNPEIKSVVDELQKSGGSAKDAFYAIARRKGVNPDEVISLLK